MPDSIVRYCVLGIHYGNSDKPELLMVDRRLVIFDTKAQAQGMAERMASGRMNNWSKDRETIYFHPKIEKGFNRISIWTNYDPYDVNTGVIAKGVRSEAHSLDWKYHVHQQEVWQQIIQFADSNSEEELEEDTRSLDEIMAAA